MATAGQVTTMALKAHSSQASGIPTVDLKTYKMNAKSLVYANNRLWRKQENPEKLNTDQVRGR